MGGYYRRCSHNFGNTHTILNGNAKEYSFLTACLHDMIRCAVYQGRFNKTTLVFDFGIA